MSLRLKLFVTLLLVTAVVVVTMFVVMQWSFERGFVGFVEARQRERVAEVVQRLADEYRDAGGWQRLRRDRGRWAAILFSGHHGAGDRAPRWIRRLGAGPPGPWPPQIPERRARRHHTDADEGDDGRAMAGDTLRRPRRLEFRMMLLGPERELLIGRRGAVSELTLSPVQVDGRTVGYLGLAPGPALGALTDIRFVRQQKRTFVLIAGVVVLLAGLLALPLAGVMTGRLRAIARGARSLAAGDYQARVEVSSGDELGRLGNDFNELAAALERAERSRRQWVVDISHELRTPLAVLRAELEALQDGVRRLDATAVNALHADVLRLGRLVDDLYDLARSDLGGLSYHKTDLDPVSVLADDLRSLAAEFRSRDIQVRMRRGSAEALRVHGDADRLSQLFRNLLTNSLRYTDEGGRLELRSGRDGESLVLDFEDTAPGVSASEAGRLFEQFHRVEGSRSRDHGGAGLGLAICRSIVEAHGGGIEARPSTLGGLWVRITLPLAP
jgi:two-component system sensor histidine kinase BaeS